MNVLIGCEFSDIVASAFRRAGHTTWSCDLIASEGDGKFHYQGNIFDFIPLYRWDLAIFHPPCTRLTVAGARWFKGREQEQQEAIEFCERLWEAPIPRIAIENPIGVLSTRSRLGKPTQIIQPWMFGHGETKATCLWLKGMQNLEPTDIVVPEWAVRADGSIHLSKKGKRDNPTHFLTGRTTRVLKGAQLEQWERIHKEPPGPERKKNRSRTYQGIADAMAAQWGGEETK